MINKSTVKLIKQTVCDYVNEHIDKTGKMQITADNVYIVRFGKKFPNWGALAYTTYPGGMYFELNYVGGKDELYLDIYKRIDSRCIRGEENGRG